MADTLSRIPVPLSTPQVDRLAKGALVLVPDYNAAERSYDVLYFQYNPEGLKRTRSGEWKKDRVRKNHPTLSRQAKELAGGHRGGGLYAASEVIEFTLYFDATDLIAKKELEHPNVLPELAFLERIALGGDEAMKTESKVTTPVKPETTGLDYTPAPAASSLMSMPRDASTGTPAGSSESGTDQPATVTKTVVHGTAPSEVILALGPRQFPVVLTNLVINEQRFDRDLAPTRAEVQVKFRVLETTEVKNNRAAKVAFTRLLQSRTEWAKAASRAESSTSSFTEEQYFGGNEDYVRNREDIMGLVQALEKSQ